MAPSEAPLSIRIPRHNWNGQAADARATLQTWAWRWESARKAGAVELDFREVEFMEPWALAMFSAFANTLRAEGVSVRVRLDPQNPSNVYMDSMGLVGLAERGETSPAWDASKQNTGLHIIRTHPDVVRFLKSSSALMSGPSDEAVQALQYGMSELARNVVQHAHSEAGGVAIAQYFPEAKALQVAICDAGVGVYQSLRTIYPELRSDLESLKLSLLPHSSGAVLAGPYQPPDNAGLGLFFCKEICWRAGGSFWMVSGKALVGVRDNDSSGRGRIYRHVNPWPGTLVVMHLPEDIIVDFAELLSVCRELSGKARADSASVGLEFVDNESDIAIESDLVRVDAGDFLEDVERARTCRETIILPALNQGRLVELDFGGARFVTQSFAHALLYEAFRTPGSLTKLSFRRCSRATEDAIRLVAAYAAASYRLWPLQ